MKTIISFKDYLMSLSERVNIVPQYIAPPLPLGQSGDRYLCQAINLCIKNPKGLINYVIPCIRDEDQVDLEDGSHLSLFYLYVFVFGKDIPEEREDEIFKKITGLAKIKPKEIEKQSVAKFYCQNYRFERKTVEPAKGFQYTNNAYEMFDEYGNEIGNISRFEDEKGVGVTVFAFGLERLFMHQCATSNIWGCPGFSIATKSTNGLVDSDELRKQAFINSHSKGRNPDHIFFSSTLLPLFD